MENSKNFIVTEEKKNWFQRFKDAFVNFFKEIGDFFAVLLLPKKIKEQVYERAVLGKEVYVKAHEKEDVKEKEEVKEDVKEKEEVKEDVKEKSQGLTKEKEYEMLYEKAAKVSLGLNLEDYTRLICLAKELNKEPRYINITGKDDRRYYITVFEKDGVAHPIFKDCTDKDNVLKLTEKDMEKVLESASKVNNHVTPIIKNTAIPYYDLNKKTLKNRLKDVIKKDLIKNIDVKERIEKVLERNDAHEMSVLYNAVSSQPEIATHFHKNQKALIQYATLGADIPNIVLRMDYIDKMSEIGSFDLKEEITLLKTEMDNNKDTLKNVLNIDVSKYEELIKKTETEIVFSEPDSKIEPELNENNRIISEFKEIIENMQKDSIVCPEVLLDKVNDLVIAGDYHSVQEISNVLSKCPTENVDAFSHSCEQTRQNIGLKEHEAVFYNDFLYITGLERLTEKYALPELKEFENNEKVKFIQKLTGEYEFIYTEPRTSVLAAIDKEVIRIGESIGYEIVEEAPEQPWYVPEPVMNPDIYQNNESISIEDSYQTPCPSELVGHNIEDDFDYR